MPIANPTPAVIAVSRWVPKIASANGTSSAELEMIVDPESTMSTTTIGRLQGKRDREAG